MKNRKYICEKCSIKYFTINSRVRYNIQDVDLPNNWYRIDLHDPKMPSSLNKNNNVDNNNNNKNTNNHRNYMLLCNDCYESRCNVFECKNEWSDNNNKCNKCNKVYCDTHKKQHGCEIRKE